MLSFQYLGFGAPANSASISRRAVTNEALANLPEGDENAERDALLSQVEARDLIKFGLIPEFCGRFPVNVSLNSLSEDMLVKILTEPQNALVLQFKALFKMDKVSDTFKGHSDYSITLCDTNKYIPGVSKKKLW